MSRALLVLLLLAGCARDRAEAPAASDRVEPAIAAGRDAGAAPSVTGTAVPPSVAGSAGAGPFAGKLGGGGHPAAPELPARAGESRSSIEGCLVARGEGEGRRFPAPAPTRAGAAPVEVALAPGGLVVTHALEHACCLDGKVSTAVRGDAITVTERLEGNPCRCMCGSTLRTAIRLAPGRYRLSVVVEHAEARSEQRPERVLEQAVEVR